MLRLIISDILLTGNFAMNKLYQKDFGASAREIMKFNSFLGIFTALFFLALNRFSLKISAFSLVMGVVSGILVMLYTVVGFKIINEEKIALYTVFLMSGGMLVPYFWGILFLNEKFSALRTIGIILIVLSMVISNAETKKINLKLIGMCIAVFFLNGFVSVVSKMHQINTSAVPAIDFVIISSVAKAIIAFVLMLFYKKTNCKQQTKPLLRSYLYIFLAAVMGGISYLLQLICAEDMYATVLYPVITGGTVILTAVAGQLFFKEKITKKLALSLAVCFAGTAMFL